MSISILCGDKEILRCGNLHFGVLHEEIESVIESDNLVLPENLLTMLNRMDQRIYGGAILIDIADYIKTQEDSNLFSSILSKAIKEYEIEYSNVPQNYKDILWSFYNAVLLHGKELKS